ncbi:MAG: hypothetical protein C5B49_08725 [Bdellovibrio sp.]|nr:MAG: hypothetical protein C5B49_08725 [Bdellovibrio sp.]
MGKVAILKNLLFMIHTRGGHNPPHVEVYYGTPENHQAWAKVRIDQVEILEASGFGSKDLDLIVRCKQGRQQYFSSKWRRLNGTRLQKKSQN